MVINYETLEKIALYKREIKRIERKLDYYRKHPYSGYCGVVRGSSKSFPYTETHFVVSGTDLLDKREKIQELCEELDYKKSVYENFLLDFSMELEKIEDVDVKTIIEGKYLYGYSEEQIAKDMFMDRSTVNRKFHKYLNMHTKHNLDNVK